MDLTLIIAIICWAAFYIYWLISAFRVKATKEAPMTTRGVIARTLFGIPFIFLIRPDFFGMNGIPYTSVALGALGDVICICGLTLCIWARRSLGMNWSRGLDVKKDHELVTRGPYARIRHPIYSGFMLLFLGAALASGRVGGYVGFGILIIGCILRAQDEELLMDRIFGKKYAEYRKKTGAFIPKG